MFVGNYFILIATCSLQLTNAGVVKDDDTRIVFPGPIQELGVRYGNDTKIDKDPCEGLNFCTVKPKDYPQALFNKMFKGKYEEPILYPTLAMLDDRQGDPDEIEDCDSTVSFESLYKVRSREGKWLTVVQAAEENFVQMVRLETCTNTGGKCFTKFTAPDNIEAYCKQTYNDWELLVHDGKDGTKRETVSLPVCCSCHYKPK